MKSFAAAREALADAPPRTEEELDAVGSDEALAAQQQPDLTACSHIACRMLNLAGVLPAKGLVTGHYACCKISDLFSHMETVSARSAAISVHLVRTTRKFSFSVVVRCTHTVLHTNQLSSHTVAEYKCMDLHISPYCMLRN